MWTLLLLGASTIRAKFQMATTNVLKLVKVYRFLPVDGCSSCGTLVQSACIWGAGGAHAPLCCCPSLRTSHHFPHAYRRQAT